MNLEFSAIHYRAVRDRIRTQDPEIDEQTLADTVEGLTDLHEILTAILRAALEDEALATGLKGRIAEMESRLERLQDRASKRRQIAKDVMVELDLKKPHRPGLYRLDPGRNALPHGDRRGRRSQRLLGAAGAQAQPARAGGRAKAGQ
jgi:hypothetical protein